MIRVVFLTVPSIQGYFRVPLDLSQLESLPPGAIKRLSRHDAFFKRTPYADDVIQNSSVRTVARELNDLCMDCGIVGYHFTRAFPEQIASKGLLTETGDDRRTRFLREHGHRFPPDAIAELKAAWSDYFDGAQSDARDNRVWFSTTHEILKGRGADRLLTYFGGEVVFMPVTRAPRIGKVLAELGEPLVIACHLDASEAHTFIDNPWGTVLVFTYHRMLNRRAQRLDLDIFLEHSVAPGRILHINSAADLGWSPQSARSAVVDEAIG